MKVISAAVWDLPFLRLPPGLAVSERQPFCGHDLLSGSPNGFLESWARKLSDFGECQQTRCGHYPKTKAK